MSLHQIDLYFPFVVFIYGFIMTMVCQLNLHRAEAVKEIDQRILDWFYGHKTLGQICLIVGSLWSLQRLILY